MTRLPITDDLRTLTLIVVALGMGAAVLLLWRSHRWETFQGRTIKQWVQVLESTRQADGNPLALRPVPTGAEPGDFTFEVPISYDALYKGSPTDRLGRLALYVDGKCLSFAQRATNGNCALVWPAVYEPPGVHQLQSQLLIGFRGRVGVGGLLPLEI